ncbi:MAG TPA: hypothetical protein VNS58_02020 [Puia sp.]|jgi:hypothetical protein|nr:hypothetical protein [Puia sp.]
MNSIKRALGIVWMILGPLVLFYLVKTAGAEITKNPVWGTRIEWGVFIVVFIPIAVGLVLFGYYAVKGEYEEIG